MIQRGDKASLQASVANQNIVTSTGANRATTSGVYDYDVLVQGSTDGLPTDPFPISVNAPWTVFATFLGNSNAPTQGYLSEFLYSVYDVAGYILPSQITVHETDENCVPNPPYNVAGNQTTWCAIGVQGSTWFAPGDQPPVFTNGGPWEEANGWIDTYSMYGPAASYPSPQYPSAQTVPVVSFTQKWFAGAAGFPTPLYNIFSGMCDETNKIQLFTDHGERQNVVLPVSSSTLYGVPPACVQGQFVNP